MFAAVDWLYSKVAVRFPDLKLCLSEGGIGWVAGLLDRLDHVGRYQAIFGTWEGVELTPREVMERNFWFCTIDDIAGLEQRHRIGVDHLLLESDYPHQDGTWPDTQEIVWSQIGGFPARRDRAPGVAQRVGAVPPPGARRAASATPTPTCGPSEMRDESMYERDRLYIGGAWVAPVDDGRIDVVNPATEEVIGHAPRASVADVNRAVAAARDAFEHGPWPRTAPDGARRCARGHGRVPARAGPPAGRAQHRRGRCPHHVRTRGELGPVAVFGYFEQLTRAFPWREVRQGALARRSSCRGTGRGDRRGGAVQRADHVGRGQARPALASGCPIVFKPAPETPLDAFVLAEAAEAAGVPPGVVNIVPGGSDVGAALVAHDGVDRVVFTGSTTAGRAISDACSGSFKRLTLELGGKAAAVLLDDAPSKPRSRRSCRCRSSTAARRASR